MAYAESADFIRFLLKGGQEHRFADLLTRLREGQAFEAAISDAYGSTAFVLATGKRDLAKRYTFWPVLFGARWFGSLAWCCSSRYMKRRERARQKLLTWAREEAAEDARREPAPGALRRRARPSRPGSCETRWRAWSALTRWPAPRWRGPLGSRRPKEQSCRIACPRVEPRRAQD